jgi:hypothetical protein
MVIFANQQNSFVLRAGEVLEQTYRLESIDSHAVTLTYLPLGVTERVPLGTAN